ncbi:hypothetical protein NP233_g8024 [Leucocoprinus birnbaumii]|uniref:Protein kinase domain-containing protein n=1 Tax=Leucocoprinus birnbaumii TaxID=56174 RepID=A0AAD5YPF5_9AGAR|nr:hypothetical protein NP233_g8024 [Leucocoprinus birnbaumii]
MRICGLAAEALHGKRSVSRPFPLKALETYTRPLPPFLAKEESASLLSRLLTDRIQDQKKLTELNLGPKDAQYLIIDSTTLPAHRSELVKLLSHVARTFHTLPRSYQLGDIQCDLTRPSKRGVFGVIYKGVQKEKSVCIKAVDVSQQLDIAQHLQELSQELISLAHLSHENILPLYGTWIPDPALPMICLVSPWMEYGNISQYISKFPETSRLLLLLDVSLGLDFLHHLDIIHGNMKNSNVLVSTTGQAMLTDLGASHDIMSYPARATQITLTPNWTAPELVRSDVVTPTKSSDIWAFGCIVYAVSSGKIPFYNQTAFQIIAGQMRGGVTPLQSDSDPESIPTKEGVRELMDSCWDFDKYRRPLAKDIVQFFAALKLPDNRTLSSVNHAAVTNIHRAKSNIELDYGRVHEILMTAVGVSDQGSKDEARHMDYGGAEKIQKRKYKWYEVWKKRSI